MIIYDIPKEDREVLKLDLSHKFAFISSDLSYISIRDGDSEKDFYCMNVGYRLDLDKIKDSYSFSNLRVCIIYSSKSPFSFNYSEYDTLSYKEKDFIKGGF